MAGLLSSAAFFETYRDDLARIEASAGLTVEPIAVPEGEEGRLDAATLERIDIAFFSSDVLADDRLERRFFGATTRAPRLRWLHGVNAGMDAPVFGVLVEHGVRLTNSSGASATPIAQTAIGGLLALARGFPRWSDAQRRHAWESRTTETTPRDLADQTLVVIGVGAIGNEIARLAQAIGLHVIGVRRSAATPDDHVDEMHTPSALPSVLPRADWLAIACPLTEETRGLIDATALAKLPAGASVVNVARGEIVDEQALIEALRSGRLAGAYLDVFEQEPLSADSPLWDLPNVIVSPHDSGASAGNAARGARMFLANLERWARDEPLENEVSER